MDGAVADACGFAKNFRPHLIALPVPLTQLTPTTIGHPEKKSLGLINYVLPGTEDHSSPLRYVGCKDPFRAFSAILAP